MENFNIVQLFFKQAISQPSAIAFKTCERDVTYGQLHTLVSQTQVKFAEQGFVNSKKVLVMHPLSIELYAALLALLANGCILVFVEEWTSLADVRKAQEVIKCDGILCPTKVRLISLLYKPFRSLKWLNSKHSSSNDKALPPIEFVSENDAAIISFSSGTSGNSKAIVRTHCVITAQFEALQKHISIKQGAIMITNFPVVILLNLGLGITTFLSEFLKISNLPASDFEKMALELNDNAVSHLAFSPFVLQEISKKLTKPISVHQVLCGGSALFPSRIREIQQKIFAKDFTILYGSSEAEPIGYCTAKSALENAEEMGLFVGRIDSATACRIVNISVESINECKSNEIGEILVNGRHVVKTYLSSEDAYKKQKVMFEGEIWHRTGDYGCFNDKGFLLLTGQPSFGYPPYCLLELEKKLASIEGVSAGTILNKKCFIQMAKDGSKKEIELKVLSLFSWVEILIFGKLPLDKRHNGKIKYGKLDA